MSKEIWIGEQESICENFAAGKLEDGEAVELLMSLGFTWDEATDLLHEAVA